MLKVNCHDVQQARDSAKVFLLKTENCSSSKAVGAHAARESLASGFSQVDHLLTRCTKPFRNPCIVERKLAPQIRELFEGQVENCGDLIRRCDAGNEEQLERARTARIAKVQ